MQADLRLEWANWLTSLPWDFFLTVTLRDPLPSHRADSVLNAIGKQLCARFRPHQVFLGAESHISRLMHFHGLYKASEGLHRDQPDSFWRLYAADIWQVLFETYGRSKVERPRDASHVAGYVSKYCVKALAGYQVFGPPDWPKAEALAFQGHFLPPAGAGTLGESFPSEEPDHPSISTVPGTGGEIGIQGQLFP